GGGGGGVGGAEPLREDPGAREGLLHGHLLVEDEADQERVGVGREQPVGLVVARPGDGRRRHGGMVGRRQAIAPSSASTRSPASASSMPSAAEVSSTRARRARSSSVRWASFSFLVCASSPSEPTV